MNIRIEKVDINNNEVINFLVEENLKLYLELNPKNLSLYNGKHHDYIMKASKEQFLNDTTGKAVIYAAFLDDLIIGCGFIDGTGYLNSLFVKAEYRNQKIGSKLLEKLIGECDYFDVIKVDAKLEAVSLYERFSFQKIGASNRIRVPMELERRKYGK